MWLCVRLPSAEIEDTNVIVMLKLISPLNKSVQKFDAIPPGHTPMTKRPKPFNLSSIKSMANAKENCITK